VKSTSPAVLLVGLALVTAACSLADSSRTPRVSSVSLKDGPDDLWSYDLAAIDDAHRSPVVVNGDALGAEVRRTATALVVKVRYADIERRASPDWGIEFEFDIGDHSTRGVTWSEYRFSDTHQWDRDLDMTRYDSEDSLSALCRRLSATPDFSADILAIRVPDGCFRHAPRVVVHDLVAHARPPGRHTEVAYDHLGTPGHGPVRTPPLVASDKSRHST
jgi:hypothetical protein